MRAQQRIYSERNPEPGVTEIEIDHAQLNKPAEI